MFKEFIQDHDLKNHLLKTIFLLIYQNGPISRAELLEKSNVKQTTLARTIQELLQKKYIREYTVKQSDHRGRPSILYHIEPTCSYIIGIQISRLEIKVVLVDLLLNVVDQKTYLMTSMHTPPIVFSKIKETVRSFMEKYQLSFDQLLGIGIGAVGQLDQKNGLLVRMEDSLAPGWVDVPITALMKEEFPVRILLENAANMAVLGEYNTMTLPVENMLYCISGRGLGCGVITNGELVRNKGISGFGHMIIDINGRLCSCGRRGCLISYTSPYAILNELLQKRPSLDLQEGIWENAQIDHVIEFFKQGDQLTEEIVMKSAEYFGVGLANMINLFHSEMVILSGTLIYEYPNYYEKVLEYATPYLLDKENVTFSQGVLKESAMALGASVFILNSYFNNH